MQARTSEGITSGSGFRAKASVDHHGLDLDWRVTELGCLPFQGNLCGGLAALLCSDSVLPEVRVSSDSAKILGEGFSSLPKLTVNQSVRLALTRAAHGQPAAVRLLLVVDQFEELFTDKRLTDADREQFVGALEALACSGAAWVIAALRSDFSQAAQKLASLRDRSRMELPPLSASALRRIIEHPARQARLSFEHQRGASLADRILDDAHGHAEGLPLISHVLRELYERRTTGGVLTFASYEDLGGLDGAQSRRAEKVFNRLPAGSQEKLASVLRALLDRKSTRLNSSH